MDDLSDVEPEPASGEAAVAEVPSQALAMDLLSDAGSALPDAPDSPPPDAMDLLSDVEPDVGAFDELSDHDAVAAPSVHRRHRGSSSIRWGRQSADSVLRRVLPGKANKPHRKLFKRKFKRASEAEQRRASKSCSQLQLMSEAPSMIAFCRIPVEFAYQSFL